MKQAELNGILDEYAKRETKEDLIEGSVQGGESELLPLLSSS